MASDSVPRDPAAPAAEDVGHPTGPRPEPSEKTPGRPTGAGGAPAGERPDTSGEVPADELPERAGGVPAGERHGGYLPEGTAPLMPPLEGTSVDAPVVQGIYRPDVGPGGDDIDESDAVLTNRARIDRGPRQPSEPEPEQHPLSPSDRAGSRRPLPGH